MFFAKSNDISYVKQKQQLDNGCEFSDGVVICSFVLCPFFLRARDFFCVFRYFFIKFFLRFYREKIKKKIHFSCFIQRCRV